MQGAYIVAGFRTAVARSKRGGFRFYRPDDLAIDVIKGLLASVPQLDPKLVERGLACAPGAHQEPARRAELAPHASARTHKASW